MRKPKEPVSNAERLMAEWDFEKNRLFGLDPERIGLGSSKKAWWKCPQGHSYDMRITQRVRGQRCPYCSNRRVLAGFNDLATTHPGLVEQWDYGKNSLTPEEVTHGSGQVAWWKCSEGHSYRQAINKKSSRRTGCPVCSGHLIVPGVNDFETCYPELAAEWHPTKNRGLLPSGISKKSGRRIWWQCEYGHEWQATPHDRVGYRTGCPVCSKRRSTSFPEQAILYYVRKLYPDAVNRYKDLFDNGMELDIYIPSIRFAIEFDGAAWHNTEEQHEKERLKYAICRANSITLWRVKEHTRNRWDDVADAVYFIHNKKYVEELQPAIQAILDSIDRDSSMWTRKNPLQFHSSVTADLDRDLNEIREYLTPIPNSLAELRPDLVEEWNYERNGNLKPEMFGINSNDRVWWRCSKCNHEWQTTIIHRAGKRNSGCPECAKQKKGRTFTKRRVQERGSLAENNPTLAAEWHPTKNGDLTPYDITEKRFANVWWQCLKCNHEWEASPNNRSKGAGCPCCSGRVPKIGVNDFKTMHSDIALEWDYEKNGELRPEQFLPKSGKKVWWKCSKCGHRWIAAIRSRTIGHGCPECWNRRRRSSMKADLSQLQLWESGD